MPNFISEDTIEQAILKRLNTGIPESAVDEALAKLTDRRYAMSAIAANREIDGLIRDGIPVEFENAQGKKEQERVRVLDFTPGSSDIRCSWSLSAQCG